MNSEKDSTEISLLLYPPMLFESIRSSILCTNKTHKKIIVYAFDTIVYSVKSLFFRTILLRNYKKMLF